MLDNRPAFVTWSRTGAELFIVQWDDRVVCGTHGGGVGGQGGGGVEKENVAL